MDGAFDAARFEEAQPEIGVLGVPRLSSEAVLPVRVEREVGEKAAAFFLVQEGFALAAGPSVDPVDLEGRVPGSVVRKNPTAGTWGSRGGGINR